MNPIQLAEMQAALATLNPSHLEVIDETLQHAGHAGTAGQNSGTHFRVRIAAPQFKGLTAVAQHRLVYAAVQEMLPRGLHALAIEIV